MKIKLLLLISLFFFIIIPGILGEHNFVYGNSHDRGPVVGKNIRSIFGEVKPPDPLNNFIQKGRTGSGGISLFTNNLIMLIYTIAGVVFIFLLLWAAWDFMTSGGDKEKIESARRKLTYAFIGLLLFALAFAIIAVVGEFTGFEFFVEQGKPGLEEKI